MKISTKGRYGLRALVDLAIHSDGEHISLSSIAERQEVSVSYLEQVFSVLRKSGLLTSVKGAKGGYILSDKPECIRVGDILRVLEGKLSIIDENIESESDVDNVELCLKTVVWDRINENINKVVDSLTLEDLINEYHRIKSSNNNMYYI